VVIASVVVAPVVTTPVLPTLLGPVDPSSVPVPVADSVSAADPSSPHAANSNKVEAKEGRGNRIRER
jgi:hypothetical protein